MKGEVVIRIKYQLASPYQRTFFFRMLYVFMDAMKTYMLNGHKNNKIDIKYD